MPSVLTHYFFVNDCIDDKYPFLKNEDEIIYAGSQGTDPFYFYGSIIKRLDKKDIYAFASLIHESNPLKLFKHFINEANKLDGVERDFVYSYLFGLMNHYVLDRYTHPFVFYHSGIDDNYLPKHQKYEANIDVLLRLHYRNYISPQGAMKVDYDDIDIISKIYYSYSENNNLSLEENTFTTAYKDMRNTQKVLYSKLGFRKWFFNKFLNKSQANALSLPKRVEGDIDYLNNKKNLWQHPSKNFKMSLSFIELMDLAKKEFNKLGKILLNAYNHLDYEKELENFIDNTNLLGTNVGEKMFYSNPIY